jgi:hypothetical protein
MLDDLALAILQMESRHYRRIGAKHAAIRDELGISPTRYFQRLNQLLDDPEAIAVAPMVVRRLQRVRDRAAEQRRRRGQHAG